MAYDGLCCMLVIYMLHDQNDMYTLYNCVYIYIYNYTYNIYIYVCVCVNAKHRFKDFKSMEDRK